MKSNTLTVMKKEFARFFGDRRMILMMLLPAILIYVVYSFMGTAMSSIYSPDESHTSTVYIVNLPASLTQGIKETGVSVVRISEAEVEGTKAKISLKEADVCIVFPPEFDAEVAKYDVQTASNPAPNIEIYFNSVEPNSLDAYNRLFMVLDIYESSLTNKFDINRDIEDADQVTPSDMSASIISTLMPMLLMIFLYSGCIGLAPEAIAGEKERGTLATLLVTPLKRSELAAGKILSLAVLAFLSGLITAAATIMSLPNLMGGGAEEYLDAAIYGATDYVVLAFVILTTILLLVTLISIISALAKSVKEANTAVMPVMIVVMLVSVTGMFGGGAQGSTPMYLIPLYSSVQSMSGIFSLDYSMVNITVSCLSNLVYACVGAFLLTKMFNSEKIMFSR